MLTVLGKRDDVSIAVLRPEPRLSASPTSCSRRPDLLRAQEVLPTEFDYLDEKR
jgi:hypothetical protein